jgi:hypothetical protein
MNSALRKISILLLLFSMQNIYSLEITEKNIAIRLDGEYNKSFHDSSKFTLLGALGLDNIYLFRSGMSLGNLEESTDVNLFAFASAAPFTNIPLDFSLYYIYNGLPNYHVHTNTILPVITYNFKYVGISAGYTFRFTTFFGTDVLYETVLSLAFNFIFINNETLKLGLRLANFSDFQAGNMAAYTLNFHSAIRVDKYLTALSELELIPTGTGGGTTILFYGIAFRAGVRYSW